MTTPINIPSDTIAPHGGQLVNRMLRGEMRQAVRERAEALFKLDLSPMNLSDLELLAGGAISPLTGFMLPADYERVVTEMRLSNGLIWSIPVTLPVDQATADAIALDQEIALCEKGHVLAVMEVSHKYTYDKQREAQLVYGTADEKHPGVARLFRQGDVLLGGEIWVVELPAAAETEFPELRHTPAQARRMFARRGWRRVVGFQTRNPIHRAHEYIQKTALEIVDGLFIHPLVLLFKGIDSRQIHQFGARVRQCEITELFLHGDAGPVADFLARPGQQVEQGGLAAVGITDKCYFAHGLVTGFPR